MNAVIIETYQYHFFLFITIRKCKIFLVPHHKKIHKVHKDIDVHDKITNVMNAVLLPDQNLLIILFLLHHHKKCKIFLVFLFWGFFSICRALIYRDLYYWLWLSQLPGCLSSILKGDLPLPMIPTMLNCGSDCVCTPFWYTYSWWRVENVHACYRGPDFRHGRVQG